MEKHNAKGNIKTRQDTGLIFNNVYLQATLLQSAYDLRATLLEIDENEMPVKAYRKLEAQQCTN